MRNPNEVQMANLALQLLSRVSIQMTELDAAAAVRDWLTSIAREPPIMQVPQGQHMNGAERPDQPEVRG